MFCYEFMKNHITFIMNECIDSSDSLNDEIDRICYIQILANGTTCQK